MSESKNTLTYEEKIARGKVLREAQAMTENPSEWNNAIEAAHKIVADMAVKHDDSDGYLLPEDALEECAQEIWKLRKP